MGLIKDMFVSKPIFFCAQAAILLPSLQPEWQTLTLASDISLRCSVHRISQTALWLASEPRDAKATSKESEIM